MSEPTQQTIIEKIALLGVDRTYGTGKPKFVRSRETLRRVLLSYTWLDNTKGKLATRDGWRDLAMALKYEVPEAYALFEAKSNEWGAVHKDPLPYVWDSLHPDGSITGRAILWAYHNEPRLEGMTNGHDPEILPSDHRQLLDLVDDICDLLAGSLPAESELRAADAEIGAQIAAAVSGEAVSPSVMAIASEQTESRRRDEQAMAVLRELPWFDPDSWKQHPEILPALQVLALDDPGLWLERRCMELRKELIVRSLVEHKGGYVVLGLPWTRLQPLTEAIELKRLFRGGPTVPVAGDEAACKQTEFLNWLALQGVQKADTQRVIPGVMQKLVRDPDGGVVVNRWLYEHLPHWGSVLTVAAMQAWNPEHIRLLERQMELLAGDDAGKVLDALSWFARTIWLPAEYPDRLAYMIVFHSRLGGVGKSTLAYLIHRMVGAVERGPGISYFHKLPSGKMADFETGTLADTVVLELAEITKEADLAQAAKELLPSQGREERHRSHRKHVQAGTERRPTALVLGTTNRLDALYFSRTDRRALIVEPPEQLPPDARETRQRFYRAVQASDHDYVIDVAAWLLCRPLSPEFDPVYAPTTAVREAAWRYGSEGLQGRLLEIIDAQPEGPWSYPAVMAGLAKVSPGGKPPSRAVLAKAMREIELQTYTVELRLEDHSGHSGAHLFTLIWRPELARAAGFDIVARYHGRQVRQMLTGDTFNLLVKCLGPEEKISWPKLASATSATNWGL